MGLLRVRSERFGQTLVTITHNEELAQMADRIDGLLAITDIGKDYTCTLRDITEGDIECKQGKRNVNIPLTLLDFNCSFYCCKFFCAVESISLIRLSWFTSLAPGS